MIARCPSIPRAFIFVGVWFGAQAIAAAGYAGAVYLY